MKGFLFYLFITYLYMSVFVDSYFILLIIIHLDYNHI